MMKKIFSFLLMSAMLLAVGASVVSCSSDDEDDGIINEQRVEKYITGYTWYPDYKKQPEFRFYRNRLVSRMSSSEVTSGSLTWDASNFFGTWSVLGDKLITKFTTGAYEGFDWDSILYGSLTITGLRSDCKMIDATDPDGYSHMLYSSEISDRFVDYTDASDHDGALVGTWEAMAHKGERNIIFTIKIDKSGNITFIAKSENIDFTTTCTTKNGHVTFTHLFEPGTNSRSFIYIREKNEIRFYSEENAQQVWVWEKV